MRWPHWRWRPLRNILSVLDGAPRRDNVINKEVLD